MATSPKRARKSVAAAATPAKTLDAPVSESTDAGTGRYTAQLVLLVTPDVAGIITAYQKAQGRTRANILREIVDAGLGKRLPVWARRKDAPSVGQIEAARLAARKRPARNATG